MAILSTALVTALALASDSPPAPAGRPMAARAASIAEHRARCAGREGWSDPAPPVRIFANVYDVGSCGIVVLLIAGDAGAVMIDAATAEAVPAILANVRRLGLQPHDVTLLLSTHEHVDHAGGFAALRRRTGATMVATAAAKPVLESGVSSRDDPQRDSDRPAFPGVRVGRVVRDGEVVRLGALRLTAHATPGHAPGGTSWSWRSCERGVCHAMVYADSLSTISADRYRFTDHPAYVAAFRASIAKVAHLPCDLLVTPHPGASDLYERLAGKAALVDRTGCARYAAGALAKLDARLDAERRPGAAARLH